MRRVGLYFDWRDAVLSWVAGAWEFMSLNVPTVAAVDWTEKSSGACGVPVAVCLVFDAFNHEFPSEVLCPSPQAMSNRQLVDLNLQGACASIHTTSALNFSYK